jgi:hypothetical protein
MGTQQILLIVLSVIIVGVAIAVGITMFRNQAYNSNQTAITGELQSYASQVVQWLKTPASQGGGGGITFATIAVADIKTFIGFTDDPAPTMGTHATDSGFYDVLKGTTGLGVVAIGTEKKGANSPRAVAHISMSGDIKTEILAAGAALPVAGDVD